MRPVDRAVWYIESHLKQNISLEDLAAVAGVSRFHLSRAFGHTAGIPATRYLRLRRLSIAAEALAGGEKDILDLALSLGYGSHEAFTRAFRDCFGTTPEQVRKQGHTHNLKLLEARRMNESPALDLGEPEILSGRLFLLAGLSKTYSYATSVEIPGQWQNFAPMIGHIPGQIGAATFGVLYNGDDDNHYDYLSGVEVVDFSRLPADLARLRIPPQTYAVFDHEGHVSEIRGTINAIWSDWLPASGREVVDAPMFEYYPESFDPQSGLGGLQVWLPIR